MEPDPLEDPGPTLLRSMGTTKQTDFAQDPLPLMYERPALVFSRIRNYLAGRHNGATRDSSLLDQVLLSLLAKIHLWRSDDAANLAGAKLRGAYVRALRDLCESVGRDSMPHSTLTLDDTSLEYVDRQLSTLDISSTRTDLVGDAYQCFKGSDSRGQEGQFFTPAAAIGALISLVDPQPGERIVDPACGAGGFLFSSAHYLLDQGAKPKDIAKSIFGIEKDSYLARLARMRLSLLTLQRAAVAAGDSLAWSPAEARSAVFDYRPGTYDVVLTNPPFGTKIVAASDATRREYDLSYRWVESHPSGRLTRTNDLMRTTPPQVLFVERCLSLVKPGGRIGMVVPESLLCGKSYRHVVDYMLRIAKIEVVLGMPEALFKTSGKGGTHTKTALLCMRKFDRPSTKSYQIFMAEAKWCGHDSRGRQIPRDDIPAIVNNYRTWCTQSRHLKASTLGYTVPSKGLVPGLLAPRAYDPEIATELNNLEESHLLLEFGDLVDRGILALSTGDEVGKLSYGTGDVPFVRTSDISSWEIKVDPKHGLSREIFEAFKNKQDVQPGDILMVRDGTYLIGTCALVTKHDTEIVLQSHIYKIRVHANDLIDAHLLLAVLSSAPVQRQIKAHAQTQDIIDSLGGRISKLVLPIPRDENKRQQISQLVQHVIRDRVEARELARRVVEDVCASGKG